MVRARTSSAFPEGRPNGGLSASNCIAVSPISLRRLAGLEAVTTSPPLDVLWFRLPWVQGDPEATFGRIGGGYFFGLFRRTDHWNVEVTIPKDGYPHLKDEGIESFRSRVDGVLPEFSEHLEHLRDWKQVSVLSVRADRLRSWHRPGPVAGAGSRRSWTTRVWRLARGSIFEQTG